MPNAAFKSRDPKQELGEAVCLVVVGRTVAGQRCAEAVSCPCPTGVKSEVETLRRKKNASKTLECQSMRIVVDWIQSLKPHNFQNNPVI